MWNIRLGSTEASLSKGYLVHSHQIPIPSIALYEEEAVREGKQDGGLALRGFVSFTLQFDTLTRDQFRSLVRLVKDAIENGTGNLMFATIDKGWNGRAAPNSWIDVKGRPHYPVVSPAGGVRNQLYENVVLKVDNLTTVNDPASF